MRWLERRRSRRAFGMLADEVWSRLPENVRRLAESMYRGEPQRGSDGEMHAIEPGAGIGRDSAAYLFAVAERLRPEVSIEVGISYGFSTVFLLAALEKNGHGKLLGIDPGTDAGVQGVGATHAKTLGMENRFEWIHERSDVALPRLVAGGMRAQLMFIDGMHTFDAALCDFTLAAQLCDEDGYVLLDDMWMPALRRVASFVEKNRADFAREPAPHNLASFRRIAPADTRAWNHYRRF